MGSSYLESLKHKVLALLKWRSKNRGHFKPAGGGRARAGLLKECDRRLSWQQQRNPHPRVCAVHKHKCCPIACWGGKSGLLSASSLGTAKAKQKLGFFCFLFFLFFFFSFPCAYPVLLEGVLSSNCFPFLPLSPGFEFVPTLPLRRCYHCGARSLYRWLSWWTAASPAPCSDPSGGGTGLCGTRDSWILMGSFLLFLWKETGI